MMVDFLSEIKYSGHSSRYVQTITGTQSLHVISHIDLSQFYFTVSRYATINILVWLFLKEGMGNRGMGNGKWGGESL